MTGSLTWGALRPIAIRFTFLAIVAIALVGALVAIPNQASAVTTVTVNSTGDAGDFDVTGATCETAVGNGVCTLRAAIETANNGFAKEILFALPGGAGTINVGTTTGPGDPLPIIEVALAIDASGNTVVIDGTAITGGSSGFEVNATLNGQTFSLKSGTGSLTIRDIDGGSTAQITGDAAVKVCGYAACTGPPAAANINLGTILIDDITISGLTDARGVHVVAQNHSSTTVSNNDITAPSDGVLLKAEGDPGPIPDLVTDNVMVVTGNDITSVDNDAVDIEVCDDAACDLASKIAISIDGNTTLDGGTADGTNDDGVSVDVDIEDATAGSSVNVTVDDNTGGITGWDGVDVEIDIGTSDAGLGASVSVSRNQGAIVGDGDQGVEVQIDIDTSGGASATTDVNNNDDISGDSQAVDVESYVDSGDGNSSAVSVSDNDNLSGDCDTVYVDSDAKDGSSNTSTVLVNGNGNITDSGCDAVEVNSFAGGTSDNNVSTVEVNGNADLSADDNAVEVVSFAGSESSAANGNTSDVEVNDNGKLEGDNNDDGSGHGIRVRGLAGSDATGCAPCGGDNNTSLVDASNNDDIEGAESAIDIRSEAGTREDSGSGNSSTVTVKTNGHIEGDTDDNSAGDGVKIRSRAGTDDALGGVGHGNSSTVTVTGDGGHDVSGGDDGIDIESEAGADTGGDGNNNTSDVSVIGNRDIFTTASDDAVGILSQAGAFGGQGDDNHATADVSANRFITSVDSGTAGDAIDIDVLAGGSDAASNTNSTDASVTSNDDIEADGIGIVVASLVCCVSANTNDVTIDQNQDIIGGDDGILITGALFPGLCCSYNTVDITDNGTVTGTTEDGLDIDVHGTSPLAPAGASHTTLTVNGNTFANSGERGIEIENFTGATADFSLSVISDNAIRNNGGAGIALDGISSTTIGPANIIEDNAGGTGIHIEESAGDADFNKITQNSIFENDGLGIDLDDDAGPNDVVGCTGPDTPNECIPFPTGVSSIDKLLSGTTCPDCLVEVFVANAVPDDQETGDPVQYGEGETFIGTSTANGAGFWTFTIPCGLGGESLTMTATGKFGSTSEFGPNFGPLPANSCAPTDTPTPVPTDTPGGPPTDTPTPANVGIITICKDTNPESSGKSFDFDTDISGMLDPDLEDDECDTQDDVDPDDYEITENPPAGWELDNIDCDGISSSQIDVDLATNTVEIDLEAGDDVECTFTNIDVDITTSSITISKETDPAGSLQEFEFESDVPGLDNFDLFDNEAEEATSLAEGTYIITEQEVPGWNLIEIDCTGTASTNIDVDLADNRVTVDLQEGEDVECSFTNEQKPTPTATPMSPTDTPTPTDTPVPPTSTNTPVPPTSTATNTPVIPATPGNTIGDVNKNGVVNAIDAQLIKQAEAGFITLANPKNADVNLDGEVNSVDALLIQQFVAGLIPSLPV